MEAENASERDFVGISSRLQNKYLRMFLGLCLGRKLREMAGGDDGTNAQEHISGPLGQPHTQSTLMCIFSSGPPGTSGRECCDSALQIMTMMVTH